VLRQPMRVAMALISTMVFLGGIYGLLGVHFIAAFQVLIYVGAVMVFMVYVIMLLEVRDDAAPAFARRMPLSIGAFAVLLAAAAAGVWRSLPPMSTEGGESGATGFGISRFAAAFLSEYWLHFELTSVLLVAAVVAALAVIRVSRRADAAARKQVRHG
jgi:NADH-quinone oxidoreductase subunit J